MNKRTQRAIRFGTAAGYWAAGIGLVLAAIHRADFGHSVPVEIVTVVVGTCASFVIWFALVGGFTYAFPPSTDELTSKTDFPGAGRLVWPIVLLLIAATIYLVFAYHS